MKKLIGILLVVALMATSMLGLVACGETPSSTYEIALVTDIGQLMDKSFNQGTWEGVEAYATANNKTYKYYQPANGADATDEDRYNAMKQACDNGAKVIVTPGFLQYDALARVAAEYPEVKFVFIDGWATGLDNVVGIAYQEEQAGYLAGYAVVKEGYTELGYSGGGGGGNPACNRFGQGFILGAEAAAKELDVNVFVKYSYDYGSSFSASAELQAKIAGWYSATEHKTQVVFACGGSMFNSVYAAAAANNGKVVGVDVDQADTDGIVITSATKGLSASVQYVLGEFYAEKWLADWKDNSLVLGASKDAVGLPTAEGSWRTTKFTVSEYNALFAKMADGTLVLDVDGSNDKYVSQEKLEKVTIDYAA